MKELTIKDIERMLKEDESRVLEVKKTTGELVTGMQSGCAFLNTDGGWLFFGIHPTKLIILGQDVADRTRQEIAWEMRKFAPTIDLAAQYIDVPDRPGKQVIAIWFPAPVIYTPPYTYDGRPFYKVENTTMLMPRDIFDDRVEFMNPGAFPQGTKPEDFRKRPHSEPINEIIANALFKGGVSEGWGRGILDIYELCKEAGLPEPEYDFVQNFVCLTIRFKTPITPYVSGGGELNGGIRGGLNGGLNDGQKKTLEYICQHEGCNTKQISIGLDVPFDTIEKQIRILLKKGLIEHRGSKKTGGYYPVKQ